MKRILVVEDDTDAQEIVKRYLEGEGFQVVLASTGPQGLQLAHSAQPDLMILDANLPGLNGFELLRQLQGGPLLPVIMVTARKEDIDKILALELGADDYLTKPFNHRELLARIRAVFRRLESALNQRTRDPAQLLAGTLRLEVATQRVYLGDTRIELTVTECFLLKYLMQHRGLIVSRQQILNSVWGDDYIGEERIVDVHIRNIRRKFENSADAPHFIQAIRGVGYRFDA